MQALQPRTSAPCPPRPTFAACGSMPSRQQARHGAPQRRRRAAAPVFGEALLVHSHRLVQLALLGQRVALARHGSRHQLVVSTQLAAALHSCKGGGWNTEGQAI